VSTQPQEIVIVGCSALLKEINALKKANNWSHVTVDAITAELHNRPEKITPAVRGSIVAAQQRGARVFVAYGDCGTGGELDRLLEASSVERIPGAHCYQFFAGQDTFDAIQEEELGTFYLTDFLARHFDRLVIRGLGLDKKPALIPMFFGHYKKLLYLAQTEDGELQLAAQQAAQALGLEYQYRYTGIGEMATSIVNFVESHSAHGEV
jgi:hypothetical protein